MQAEKQIEKTKRSPAAAETLENVRRYFGSIDSGIKEYYGKDLGARAKNFLAWLAKNKEALFDSFRKDAESGRVSGGVEGGFSAFEIGVWLGGRYAAEYFKLPALRYPAIADPKKYMRGEGDDWVLGYSRKMNKVLIGKEFSDYGVVENCLRRYNHVANALVYGVNVGMHEYTHAYPYITGKSQRGTLSEVAAFHMTNTYGLPAKADGYSGFLFGTSNPFAKIREAGKKGSAIDFKDIGDGYLVSLAGPWIEAYYEKRGGLDITKFAYPEDRETAASNGASIGRFMRSRPPDFLPKIIRNFMGKELYGVAYPAGEHFCSVLGITDKDLVGKFVKVFRLLALKEWKDEKGFIKEFTATMNQVFGEPKREDIPDGYTLLYDVKENSLASSKFSGMRIAKA